MATQYIYNLIIPEEFFSEFYHYLVTLISNAANYITVILDNSLVFRVTIPDAVLIHLTFWEWARYCSKHVHV